MSITQNGTIYHNLSGNEMTEKIIEYLTEDKKALGEKFDKIIKDELTPDLEKKEEGDTGKVQTAS
jgi:hypothetical protein